MFTKFFLKNGLGGPGETTKKICERYNYFLSIGAQINSEEIMHFVYQERYLAHKISMNKTSMYDHFTFEKLYSYSKNDLTYFIFLLQFAETANFRNGVCNYQDLLTCTNEIIIETVNKLCGNTEYSNMGFLMLRTKSFTASFKPFL